MKRFSALMLAFVIGLYTVSTASAVELVRFQNGGTKSSGYIKSANFGTNKLAVANGGTGIAIPLKAPLQAVFNGTLADGTTYKRVVLPCKAGIVKTIMINAMTKPVGGTNTVAVEKVSGGTSVTLLSAATFDPVTITANATPQALTLATLTATKTVAATDCIVVTWTTGTQSTDCIDGTVAVDLDLN